jgi:hypothetical protein
MKLNLNGIVRITLRPYEIELVDENGGAKFFRFESEEEKFKALKEAEEEDECAG